MSPVINDAKAEVVRWIFAEFLDKDISLRSIAAQAQTAQRPPTVWQPRASVDCPQGGANLAE